jgi:hypothetical protein
VVNGAVSDVSKNLMAVLIPDESRLVLQGDKEEPNTPYLMDPQLM